MKKDHRRHILFRYALITAGILFFSACIIAKVFDTTVLSADKWNEKAMKELSRVDPIKPDRGNILACDGSVLATDLRYYTVRMDFRSEKFMRSRYVLALDSIADSMATHFPVRTRAEWKEYLKRPLEYSPENAPRSFRILRNISYADYLLLRTFPFFNIKNRNRNGLIKETRMRRKNPYGDMARRSVGVVSEQKNRQVRGISGLEKALDSLLYGIPGVAKRIPLTKDIVQWADTPAVPGYDVRTTIDINMQDIVENELNNVLELCDADWGVAVLMEVATGDIKAISNLEKDKRSGVYVEGMNRAVRGFEPGSVVKTLSMMIALEDGIVRNTDSIIVTGSAFPYAGGRPITDAHGVPSLTVGEVIERSSNIGMAKIMIKAFDNNPGGFYSRLKRMGFLEPMNTGIAGESVPRIDSVPNNRGGRISMSRMCYGYATEIPPMYTLSIYNAIANGGKYVRPRLVAELIGQGRDSVMPVTYIRDRICSESTAAKMREMLRNVVWGDHGTGRLLRNEYVEIAGKTGTCYMVDTATHAYDTSKKRLAFCGFFPARNPLYSCIVLTCNPKRYPRGAASTSGQVLKNVALKMFSRGMLNNHSDYMADVNPGTMPTLYASLNSGKHKKFRDEFSVASIKRFATPDYMIDSGIPDVVGFGVRDAIAVIEKAGYNVGFSGSGYVTSQIPPAGTRLNAGDKVILKLVE